MKRKRVYRRTARKSRGVKRRRLSARRGKFRIRSRRGVVLTVKRRFYGGAIAANATTTLDFWQYVSPTIGGFSILNDGISGIPTIGEYTALFDQYKVNAYKIEFKPRVRDLNQGQTLVTPSGATATFTEMPYISIAIDKYSTTAPTGTYGLGTYNFFCEQHNNVKCFRGDKAFSVYVKKPMCTEQYAAGATRYVPHTWTDLTGTANQALQLRGFHIFAHMQNFNVLTHQYDVYVTYYISFRGMK